MSAPAWKRSGARQDTPNSARMQREICAKYARACRIPLVLVRDPAEPHGYRWEDGAPERERAAEVEMD